MFVTKPNCYCQLCGRMIIHLSLKKGDYWSLSNSHERSVHTGFQSKSIIRWRLIWSTSPCSLKCQSINSTRLLEKRFKQPQARYTKNDEMSLQNRRSVFLPTSSTNTNTRSILFPCLLLSMGRLLAGGTWRPSTMGTYWTFSLSTTRMMTAG